MECTRRVHEDLTGVDFIRPANKNFLKIYLTKCQTNKNKNKNKMRVSALSLSEKSTSLFIYLKYQFMQEMDNVMFLSKVLLTNNLVYV